MDDLVFDIRDREFVLMFVLVGFLTILAVGLMGIVFPIVGAVKANNGELWDYPLTIKFLK